MSYVQRNASTWWREKKKTECNGTVCTEERQHDNVGGSETRTGGRTDGRTNGVGERKGRLYPAAGDQQDIITIATTAR